MFCQDCEQKFSKYETQFSNNIFYPYINEELSREGIASGKIKYFDYSEWLLKFCISVQYRIILTSNSEKYTQRQYNIFNDFKSIWSKYLLDKRNDTGNCRTYLIFLQNMLSGKGSLPSNINDKVNFYILRSIDATPLIGKNKLGVYSKLGPIVIFTSILPSRLPYTDDIILKKKGTIKTAQILENTDISQYILITRPNETMHLFQYSEKQKNVISETYSKNIEKFEDSIIYYSMLGDYHIQDLKEEAKEK